MDHQVHDPDEPSLARELLDVCQKVSERASERALAFFDSRAGLDFEVKASAKHALSDLVSQADRAVEADIRAHLLELRPRDGFWGEEGGRDESGADIWWIVDPIDATMNFAYGRHEWAVSIAAARREPSGEMYMLAGVVVSPFRSERFWAARGSGAWCNGTPITVSEHTQVSQAMVELGLGGQIRRGQIGAVMTALSGSVRDFRRGGCAALALCDVASGRADAHYGPGLAIWDCAAGSLIAAEAGAAATVIDGDVLVTSAPGVHEDLVELIGTALAKLTPDGRERSAGVGAP